MYRFSASLNKDLSLEGLRVALFNYACAKQNGKNFIVRIEDIDKARKTEGKDSDLLELLSIFGLKYDYLYYQSENFKYHLQFASSLMDKGQAFACFCKEENTPYDGKCINISQQELLNNNLPFTIRIKRPKDALHVKDTLQGEVTFEPEAIDSFVIMSQEKYPTHNFANACDDMLQGISHIIENQEDIVDAARQEWVRVSLGYTEGIRYTHLPSMSNAQISVKSLLDQGFLPEAISEYLFLLGGQTSKETFNFDAILNSPVAFEMEKLEEINQEHIKALDDMELSKIIGYSSKDIGKLAKLFTKEVSTTFAIKSKVDEVFSKKSSDIYADELEKLKQIVKDAPYFEAYEAFKAYLIQESDFKEEEILKPLSILLTTQESEENLEEIYNLMKNYLGEIAR